MLVIYTIIYIKSYRIQTKKKKASTFIHGAPQMQIEKHKTSETYQTKIHFIMLMNNIPDNI